MHSFSLKAAMVLVVATLAVVGCGQAPTAPRRVARAAHVVQPPAWQADPDAPPPGAGWNDGDEASFGAPPQPVVPNQLIVAVEPGRRVLLNHNGKTAPRVTHFPGFKPVREFTLGYQWQVVTIPPGMTREEAERRISQQPGVKGVHANRAYSTCLTPSDPRFGEQYALKADRIDAVSAWDRSIDASKVTVAVLDTGVDYYHPDLQGRVVLGPDLAEGDNDPMDSHGHGTHVAGIIGASGNNGQGIAGVAWNCKIMAIRVLDEKGNGDTAAVVEGIKYAVDHGAKVINMSLGTSNPVLDPVIHLALDYAHKKGVTVVAAAGNNHGQVGSPANDPFAIAVSSTSSFWKFEWLSFFSNRGEKVDVAAPGGGILSTLPRSGSRLGSMYGKLSGTSMAAPFVAGEAALILAQHPDWSFEQVRGRIRQAVDDKGSSGKDDKYGYGRINVRKALD